MHYSSGLWLLGFQLLGFYCRSWGYKYRSRSRVWDIRHRAWVHGGLGCVLSHAPGSRAGALSLGRFGLEIWDSGIVA